MLSKNVDNIIMCQDFPPILDSKAVSKLEANIKTKDHHKHWGVPALVEKSLDVFIPCLPPVGDF